MGDLNGKLCHKMTIFGGKLIVLKVIFCFKILCKNFIADGMRPGYFSP